jgi:tetratricopeptide (TPR) repeat protein
VGRAAAGRGGRRAHTGTSSGIDGARIARLSPGRGQLVVAVELTNLGYVEKAGGRLEAAEASLREAIPISLEIRNSYVLAHNLVALASIVAAAGRPEKAARLLGKADAIFAETRLVLDPADKPEYDEAIATARAALGDGFETAYASGANLDVAAL